MRTAPTITTTIKLTTTTTKRPTTTTTTTRRTTLGTVMNDTGTDIPTALRPNKDIKSWCSNNFVLEGVQLVGGLKSGLVHELGDAVSMKECMTKCCNIIDCTTAYYENSRCYGLRCLDKAQCKARIAETQHSVGYIIRNGWSLFKNEQEALEGATFSSNSNNSNSKPNNVQVVPNNPITVSSFLNSTSEFNHPNLAQSDNHGYCEKKEALTDHRLIAGMKAGVFTDHGDVSDLQSCVMYCCRDRSCDMAYLVDKTCFSVKCLNEKSCQTFAVPKFFLNPIIAFVRRTKTKPTAMVASQTPTAMMSTSTLTKPSKHKYYYSDHDSLALEDVSLGAKHHRSKQHKQIGGHSHFNSGVKRHKEKNHNIHPDKKKSVPTGSSDIQSLIHQILTEEGSGSGEESHISGISQSGDGSGFGAERLGFDSDVKSHHKHSIHKVYHLKHSKKHLRHKKKHFHHKKKHHKKHQTNTPTTTPRTKKTTAKVTTLKIATTENTTAKKKHFFPLNEVDIEMIQALSPDKGMYINKNKRIKTNKN